MKPGCPSGTQEALLVLEVAEVGVVHAVVLLFQVLHGEADVAQLHAPVHVVARSLTHSGHSSGARRCPRSIMICSSSFASKNVEHFVSERMGSNHTRDAVALVGHGARQEQVGTGHGHTGVLNRSTTR